MTTHGEGICQIRNNSPPLELALELPLGSAIELSLGSPLEGSVRASMCSRTASSKARFASGLEKE